MVSCFFFCCWFVFVFMDNQDTGKETFRKHLPAHVFVQHTSLKVSSKRISIFTSSNSSETHILTQFFHACHYPRISQLDFQEFLKKYCWNLWCIITLLRICSSCLFPDFCLALEKGYSRYLPLRLLASANSVCGTQYSQNILWQYHFFDCILF